jgi:hypothetical protein
VHSDPNAHATLVLQCLQVKPLTSKQVQQDGQDRYRIILSDVDNFMQSMLATRKFDLWSQRRI